VVRNVTVFDDFIDGERLDFNVGDASREGLPALAQKIGRRRPKYQVPVGAAISVDQCSHYREDVGSALNLVNTNRFSRMQAEIPFWIA